MPYSGLSYHAAHFVADKGRDQGRWLELGGGKIRERGLKALNVRPLHLFIEENIDFVADLVEWFRANSYGA